MLPGYWYERLLHAAYLNWENTTLGSVWAEKIIERARKHHHNGTMMTARMGIFPDQWAGFSRGRYCLEPRSSSAVESGRQVGWNHCVSHVFEEQRLQRGLAKGETKINSLSPKHSSLAPRRTLCLLEIHFAMEKHIKRGNPPYLLNPGGQMLQGAQVLRWDPVNPSKQYGNHYICLELRASHLHTPFFSLSHCLREVFHVFCGRSGLGVGVTDILLRGRWWANGGNAYLGFLEERFDLQINLGLVINNFLMPIKIWILGNQSVAVLSNLLENM